MWCASTHELASAVVARALVTACDFVEVVACYEAQHKIGCIYAFTHGVDDVPTHVGLIKPYVQAALSQELNNFSYPHVVASVLAPVMRGKYLDLIAHL